MDDQKTLSNSGRPGMLPGETPASSIPGSHLKIPGLLSLAAVIAFAACLAAGNAMARQWVALGIGLAAFLAWMLARKWPFPWLVTTVLVISVAAAITSLLFGATPFLMIPGTAFALASWDLVLFEAKVKQSFPSPATALLVKKHSQSLTLALGIGLIIAFAGRMIRLQIPFGLMILLVILLIFSLDRAWRALSH